MTEPQPLSEATLALMRGFNAATVVLPPAPFPPSVETGIFFDVPPEVYHRRQMHTVSKTALDEFNRSPATYLEWLRGYEQHATPALLFGRAMHMAILEPERFKTAYAVLPDFGDMRSSKNRAHRDAWLRERGNPEPISAADLATILGMFESVMKHPKASQLIVGGRSEVTLRWNDPVTGLPCKSRADYWVPERRFATDLKSTEDARKKAFSRSAATYGYHRQDALYRNGFAECGAPIDHFAIVAIEKVKPYLCQPFVLEAEDVRKGFASVRRDIDGLADCIASGVFPGYSDGIEPLSLPPWAE